jgi:hypothetical protein
MRTEILTTLIEARQCIAAGWTQNHMEKDGKRCIVGALSEACIPKTIPHRSRANDIYNDAYDAIRAEIPEEFKGLSLMTWNDRDGQTQREVLDVFDRAIAKMMREVPAPVVRERELEPA